MLRHAQVGDQVGDLLGFFKHRVELKCGVLASSLT